MLKNAKFIRKNKSSYTFTGKVNSHKQKSARETKKKFVPENWIVDKRKKAKMVT